MTWGKFWDHFNLCSINSFEAEATEKLTPLCVILLESEDWQTFVVTSVRISASYHYYFKPMFWSPCGPYSLDKNRIFVLLMSRLWLGKFIIDYFGFVGTYWCTIDGQNLSHKERIFGFSQCGLCLVVSLIMVSLVSYCLLFIVHCNIYLLLLLKK